VWLVESVSFLYFKYVWLLTIILATGKSSLIRAIVQQCEDIVHVDPLTVHSISDKNKRSGKEKDGSKPAVPAPRVLEIMASTKAYPTWWTDMDESRILRRRKSYGETILERNLCFIDPIGYTDEQRDSLIEYIEEAFWHIDTIEELTDLERINMVSGKGTNLVDVVLFIFSDCKSHFHDSYNFMLNHFQWRT
jgi:hypothetical protein